MGKLFLPVETRGLWDSKSKSLTVYCGEDAFVGFQGSAAEVGSLQFSAWSSKLGECANETYDEGFGKRSTRIDTSAPGELAFEATDGEKNLAPPITIYIERRPAYSQMRAEGQIDDTACWAACLAWWLRVLPDRPTVEQSTIVNKLGVGLWNNVALTLPQILNLHTDPWGIISGPDVRPRIGKASAAPGTGNRRRRVIVGA